MSAFRLENPLRLLRELKGAPLSVVLALQMARQRVSQSWLEQMTGYSDKPVSEALAYLQEVGYASHTPSGWQLVGAVVQLPMPLQLEEGPAPAQKTGEIIDLCELDGEKTGELTDLLDDPDAPAAFSEKTGLCEPGISKTGELTGFCEPAMQKTVLLEAQGSQEAVGKASGRRKNASGSRKSRKKSGCLKSQVVVVEELINPINHLNITTTTDLTDPDGEIPDLGRTRSLLRAAHELFGVPIVGDARVYQDEDRLLGWIAQAYTGWKKDKIRNPVGLIYRAFEKKQDPDPLYLERYRLYLPYEFVKKFDLDS